MKKRYLGILLVSLAVLSACNSEDNSKKESKSVKYETVEVTDGKVPFTRIVNPDGGATLSFSKDGSVKIVEVKEGNKTLAFKDTNGNGELDVWEDWRKPSAERAEALAKELSKEEIAGLMLFSNHESEPEKGLTDDQRKYLEEDHLRNVLNAGGNDVEAVANWNNEMQAYVESLAKDGTHYIPVNFSSDPRSTAGSDASYNAEGDISRWPSNLGLAATFNPETMLEFAKASSAEYRAMGIATALGPQIEVASEPRWLRVDGTFGEDTELSIDMTKAYVDGSQSTYAKGKDLGWGHESINTMIKHFPGDGMGEGGRESHMEMGKFAVYPGDNFKEHLKPFLDGGLKLNGKTEEASSMMASYSIAIDKDGKPLFKDAKGSAYDKEKIDILRKDNNYDGVLSTDWGVTIAEGDPEFEDIGTAWGVQADSVNQRHFDILKSGIDMYGGNNDVKPVLAAYELWEKEYKDDKLDISADERFAQTAERLLNMLIQPGLFEDPYLSIEESKEIVGSPDKTEAGYQAQLDSVVMLKNSNETIKEVKDVSDFKEKKVYIPSSHHHSFANVFAPASDSYEPTMSIDIAKEYFKDVVTDDKTEKDGKVTFTKPDTTDVDMIIVGMNSPDNGSVFSGVGRKDDKYYPISLQYRSYTADGKNVRKESISGDIKDGKKENRSYYGETSIIGNESDLDAFERAVELAKEIKEKEGKDVPIIVALKAKNPTIVSEFEKNTDAIVTGFSVSDKAYFDIILGQSEPQGLLPIQFPKNMDTVEAQLEDVSHDMDSYKDSDGNEYDFAYGLNYKGIIKDDRVKTYKK